MGQAPDHPAAIRVQLHSLAADLTEFIETASGSEPDLEWLTDYVEQGGMYADHPNLPAFLHNHDVGSALEPILPLDWPVGLGEAPTSFLAVRGVIGGVLARWNWVTSVDERLPDVVRLIRPEDPAVSLSPQEVMRLSRAVKGLERALSRLPATTEQTGSAYSRSQLHQFAAYLAEFLEAVEETEFDPERIASYREGSGRFADHANLPAYFHNIDVVNTLDTLLPFWWCEDERRAPAALLEMRAALIEVGTRWGWKEFIEEGFPERTDFVSPESPALVFTPAERARFRHAFKAINWHLFTMPLGEESPAEPSEPPYRRTGDATIDGLLAPVFFRTRRFLDGEGMEALGTAIGELKASPEAYEVYQTHLFRKTFRVGQTGQSPDRARLLSILERAEAFLVAAEACLPVEGDEAGASTFTVGWPAGEFYVCEAASALCDVLDGPDGELGDSSVAYAHGWNAEVNFGLRSLAARMDDLLQRWDIATWEWRLAHAKPGSESPVTIGAEKLAGLRRIVETIERGVERLGLDAAEEAAKPTAEGRPKDGLGKRWRIVKVYHDHPDWSLSQIAAEAGANRGHVSRVLKTIRAREAVERRGDMPRGFKDREGGLDAWTA